MTFNPQKAKWCLRRKIVYFVKFSARALSFAGPYTDKTLIGNAFTYGEPGNEVHAISIIVPAGRRIQH